MQRDLRTELCCGAEKHRLRGPILFRITADFWDLYWHQRQSWWRTGTNRQQRLLLLLLCPLDNLGQLRWILNDRHYRHCPLAFWTDKRVHFVDFL